MIAIPHLPKIKEILKHRYTVFYGIPAFTFLIVLSIFLLVRSTTQEGTLRSVSAEKAKNESELRKENTDLQNQVSTLKNRDEFKINQNNTEEIKKIQDTYKSSVTLYENLLKLKEKNPKLSGSFDTLYAAALKQLADKNYTSASATLSKLGDQIKKEEDKIAATQTAQVATNTNIPVNNQAPGSGYNQQKVHTDAGDFVISIVAADLGSTRVIVDTASDNDCSDNCPVLNLGDYVGRNGAFAGINGSYFCPASYPTCAGKTNSFDLLVMNKNKHYFNSDNNVYSTNPAVIFQSGSVRFVGQASQWGRDTGVDSVLSNYPLMVSGGQSVFTGDGDPKKGSKGPRGFVGAKGSTIYIGVVSNATVAEAALALKVLGMDNAMNLDSGGSTALWYGGYKAGPGRAIPNAILFVRK